MNKTLGWVIGFMILGIAVPLMLVAILPPLLIQIIGVLGLVVAAVALIRPLPSLKLEHRGITFGVGFIALMMFGMAGAVQDQRLEQERLLAMRQADSSGYLAILKTSDKRKWLKELQDFDPDAYTVEMAKAAAATQEKVSAAPTTSSQTFTKDDLVWDQSTRPYQQVVLKGVNKLHRENHRCQDMDLGTVTRSTQKGSTTNPVFFVVCGKGNKAFNAYFSQSDVEADKRLAAIRHLDRGRAVALCERYAKSKAAHPSTVDFSRLLDLRERKIGNGRTQIFSKFTAKNSLNMELTYDIVCLLNANGLIEGRIAEAR